MTSEPQQPQSPRCGNKPVYKVVVAQLCPETVQSLDCSPLGSSVHGSAHGLPFPSPQGLSNQGIKPRSPALQADSLPSEPPGKPKSVYSNK